MKKSTVITIIVIILVAAGLYWLKQISKTAGPAYKLAQDLKAAGLAIRTIKVTQADQMLEEVIATGEGINIKIDHYGNGLFMEKITESLEKDKKEGKKIPDEPPLYIADLFSIVVYSEPEKGMVKNELIRKFGQVQEY